ncbi:MAG: NAD(P)-dependent oxidoreductase, partial [Acidobacteriales bacterium]|nr:NAD(P)-dependent oxidoreductase [Terriglobales bacterium]
IVVGNLKSKEDCLRMTAGVDLVIHAAAGVSGAPADMFLDSVVASRNLLDAIVANHVQRVVMISSFGVYGVSEQPRGSVVDEATPLERHPQDRDVYSHTKLRQEELFWNYKRRYQFELIVLRPGVIYGPGGGEFSGRVGLNVFGIFAHVGGKNLLPLTYVENCADAIVAAALTAGNDGEIYNVVDDGTVRSRDYLRQYQREVRKMRTARVPYWTMQWLSRRVSRYAERSKGQLPAIFTPYKAKALWGGNKFSNAKLHSIGWFQPVPTQEALRRTFESFREKASAAKA